MKTIDVAIGMIFQGDKVLLTSRPKAFMQGFWEFAGGKIEQNETPLQCLQREFVEELGITITSASLLRNVTQTYPDRVVHLSVFIINSYQEKITPQEGQQLAWADAQELDNYQLLPTVRNLFYFATLPKMYWITPEVDNNTMNIVLQKIQQGITLVQLRSKKNVDISFVKEIYRLCQTRSTTLMLNIPNATKYEKYCDGLHLTGKQLQRATSKTHGFMSASAHNLQEVQHAEKLGFDFVVLSPIQTTQTHPEAIPLGFESAQHIVQNTQIPIYFLGGMSEKNLPQVMHNGGVGIAGISKI
jgi:8-oxo-dGTP diphosphatase